MKNVITSGPGHSEIECLMTKLVVCIKACLV